jgi:hypothetical protein
MADGGKSKKAGRSKKGDLGKLNTTRHRARRIKREEARQALNATLRPARLRLRKLGALRRIARRLAAATSDADRLRLSGIQTKVRAALTLAGGAA